MDFSINENQQMIAEMIKKFGTDHIRPKMMEWDESQEFPIEVFKKFFKYFSGIWWVRFFLYRICYCYF